MATMADVARRAGVTKSTVSHVINRTRAVSQETVAAIEQAMDELGYVPNILARSLARATTDTVGLAISSLSNIYFSDIIQAVEKACTRRGLMVFLADTADNPAQELKLVRAFHQRRVDGIILAPCADPERGAIRYLRENDIPCVLLDRLVSPDFDQIGVENTNAVKQLVDHLAGHGHRRIGMLSNQAGPPPHRRGSTAIGLDWRQTTLPGTIRCSRWAATTPKPISRPRCGCSTAPIARRRSLPETICRPSAPCTPYGNGACTSRRTSHSPVSTISTGPICSSPV